MNQPERADVLHEFVVPAFTQKCPAKIAYGVPSSSACSRHHACNLRPKPDGTGHVFPDSEGDHRVLFFVAREEFWICVQATHGLGQPSVAASEGFVPGNPVWRWCCLSCCGLRRGRVFPVTEAVKNGFGC